MLRLAGIFGDARIIQDLDRRRRPNDREILQHPYYLLARGDFDQLRPLRLRRHASR